MSSNHVWQGVSVGLPGFYYLLTLPPILSPSSSFFQSYFLSFYLSHDPGDLGGGPGCGLVGPEFRAPG